MNEKTFTVKDLMISTNAYRDMVAVVPPDKHDPDIPPSVFKYEPVTWLEPEGIYHTLLRSLPDEGIWTIGTTPLESMQEFDKELQLGLNEQGEIKRLPGRKKTANT